jgi:ATP-dependent Clp protease ATP-binding subunit ClpC
MAYNIDEKEITKLKEQSIKLNKEIEQAVITSNYKKASKLKEKQANLEKEIFNIKKEFSIPKKDRFTIEKEDIQNILSITTGIPANNLTTSEIERLKKLPQSLRQSIIGQEEAVTALVKSIMRNKV